MTTLEKLAERVREQGGIATLSCEVCACKPRNSERCTQHSCPQEQAPDGPLMLARWAVKLVAEGLPSWEAFERALHREAELRTMWADMKMGKADFSQTAYLASKVAEEKNRQRDAVIIELSNLITEARAEGCKSEKQAEEGADGCQG